MPRTARSAVAGFCYHVINRGNARSVVFHDATDFRTFLALAVRACRRVPMDVLAYCLMPNHLHFVLRPPSDDSLSRWMHWISASYIHRYRKRHGGSGHLWQGRFKAFPIQEDGHLFTVIRYVERNALRAGLVTQAERWPWGSLARREAKGGGPPLAELPLPPLTDWKVRVNRAEASHELDALRASVNRGTPFGTPDWVHEAARLLHLEHAIRPRGRPQKTPSGGDIGQRPTGPPGSLRPQERRGAG